MARTIGSRAWPGGGGSGGTGAASAADTLTDHDRLAHRGGAARWEPLGMSVTPALDLRGIDKSFGSVKVLHDVSFSAYPGEITALVGDNGAGKSTLVNCIGGIHSFDRGEYRFEGEPVKVSSPRAATRLGIEIVHQDLALCENLDVVQNLFLGRELHSGLTLDEEVMEEAARATLSGGQRQIVAIARAILLDAKVVVLDEPSAALGIAQSQQVLEFVRRLADKGLAVVLISHNMNDVFAISDRIAALYLGRMVAQVRTADVTHRQVVELITSGTGGELGLRR
jgi:D-xylose transport system ATP-binding protein